MTKQETFDFVCKKLIEQGCLSENGVICLYRGPNNTKCAAGHLIPDDKYKEDFEGEGLHSNQEIREVISNQGHDISLVIALQKCHDNCLSENFVSGFKKRAMEVAKSFNLDASILN